MAIIIMLMTSVLVLQMNEIPAAESNTYYQNKTETCSIDSVLYSGPECRPRPKLISLPSGPLGRG